MQLCPKLTNLVHVVSGMLEKPLERYSDVILMIQEYPEVSLLL